MRHNYFEENNCSNYGCRQCSLNSSAPSILPPQVRGRAHNLCFKQFNKFELCYVGKTKIIKKRPGIGQFIKKMFELALPNPSQKVSSGSDVCFAVTHFAVPFSSLFILLRHGMIGLGSSTRSLIIVWSIISLVDRLATLNKNMFNLNFWKKTNQMNQLLICLTKILLLLLFSNSLSASNHNFDVISKSL